MLDILGTLKKYSSVGIARCSGMDERHSFYGVEASNISMFFSIYCPCQPDVVNKKVLLGYVSAVIDHASA